MGQLIFANLWLVSEKDRAARQVPLKGPKILLLGPNGTGKSRITKNIFWALGCEPPKRNAGSWDPDTIAALEFSIDGRSLIAVRAGKAQGLWQDGKLLFASSNHAAWSDFTARLFGYRLNLQRPNSNTYRAAGLDYLAVPFYVDQDGSWGVPWTPFKNLDQFSGWKSPVFASFTGQRPNAYLEAKQRRDEVKAKLGAQQKELDAQRQAFRHVRDVLPKELPSLDLAAFRSELTQLANSAKQIQQRQVHVRAELIAVVNERQQVEAELKLAAGAHRELAEDLKYLSAIPDSTNIECPTCGTLHQTSFHARLALTNDGDTMAALVAELNQRYEAVVKKEGRIRQELRDIEKEVTRFDTMSQEKKARLRIEEVLSAHSKRTLDRAFHRVSESLTEKVEELQRNVDTQNQIVAKYEDRARLREVSDYYAAKLRHLSDALNIPQDERVDETKVGSRPESGGSSGPRAILAIHLAMLATNVEYGDTVRLPFVVDTPQQSGQDENNLRRMIKVTEQQAADNHQLILAIERLPADTDVSEFNILQFEHQQGLLKQSEFDGAVDSIGFMLRELKSHALKEAELSR